MADEDGRGGGVLLADAFVVFTGVAAGLDFSARVGAVVGLAEVVPECVGSGVEVPVVAPAVVVGEGLDVADDGVAGGLVVVGGGLVGVAVGEVGVGDGLGGAGGSCSGSQA